MPLTFPEHFLSRVIIVIIILVIAFSLISVAFGFDFFKQITQPPPGAEDLSEPKDMSATQEYENYELNYEGMILERGVGVGNITQLLQKRVEVADCYECSSCSDVDVNGDGKNDIFNCQKCGMCGRIPSLIGDVDGNCIVNNDDLNACNAHRNIDWQPCDWNKNDTVDMQDLTTTGANLGSTCSDLRFKNCWGCTNNTPGFSNENCTLCDDMIDEYEICKKLKSCIYEHYADKSYKELHGCLISQIPFNETASFDVDAFKNILKSCRSEPIKINMGNNILKELCYFNNTSISYYDFERPNDFYLSYTVHSEGSETAQSDSLNLVPFYKEGEDSLPKYRIYVAINGDPDTEYTISVGKYPLRDWIGRATGNSANLGTILTDSTGFGHGEFIELPEKTEWCYWAVVTLVCGSEDWKKEPEKYPIKGIGVSPTPQSISATFYVNKPDSNQAWSNELRYSNCNFNTNIEPYLQNKPWWTSDNELESSWKLAGGNQNSSIKVFYDSSMPGGEIKAEEKFSFTDGGAQIKEVITDCFGDCRDKNWSPESICQSNIGASWHAIGVDCENIDIKNAPDGTYVRDLTSVWQSTNSNGWCEDFGGEDMAVICINKPTPLIKEVVTECDNDCRDKNWSPESICQSNIDSEWHAIGVDCEDINIKNDPDGTYVRDLTGIWRSTNSNGWCENAGGEDMAVICMKSEPTPIREVVTDCFGDCRDKDWSPESICQSNIDSEWHAIGVDCENINIDIDPDGTYVRDLTGIWQSTNSNGWCEDSGGEDMAVICSTNPVTSDTPIRGNLKIQLGRLDTDFLRECKFDLYICSQNAFAESEDDSILALTDFFTNFNFNNVYTTIDDGNQKIVLYNYFEFDLRKSYTIEEITSAIKTGFRLWETNKFLYDSLSSPIEWLKNNNGISTKLWNEITGVLLNAKYSNDCWNNDVKNYILNQNTPNLIYNCPNGVCSNKLKIRIAIKYTKPDALSPLRKPLYPTIIISDTNSDVAGNTCSAYGGFCEPTRDCAGDNEDCYCSNCLDCTVYPAKCCCVQRL